MAASVSMRADEKRTVFMGTLISGSIRQNAHCTAER